jgi:hypothetical protein
MASRANPPFPLSVALARLDLRKQELELGTDDFVLLMLAFADEVGVDLTSLGKRVWLRAKREEVFKLHAAVALRSIFEVEGYYAEIEGTYTLFKVPTKLLVVVGAALIGMATGEVYKLDPVLAGAVGGVGSLLINILSARYMEPDKASDLTWTEELILTLLRDSGEQSLKQLQGCTRLYKQTLKDTLASLLEKGVVESQGRPGPKGKSELRYHAKGEAKSTTNGGA